MQMQQTFSFRKFLRRGSAKASRRPIKSQRRTATERVGSVGRAKARHVWRKLGTRIKRLINTSAADACQGNHGERRAEKFFSAKVLKARMFDGNDLPPKTSPADTYLFRSGPL